MPFKPLPSLREISQRCGVAKSTVGHILGGRSHLFRPETRELVVQAAEDMGWKRPADWRSVRRARFGCVVLLQSLNHYCSIISSNMFAALEDRLIDRNMHVTLARLPDETLESETALRRLLKQWSADGMFVSYTQHPPPRLRSFIAKFDLPAVWLNSRAEIDAVRPDDIGAGRRAAELLLEAGHRRISYVSYPIPAGSPVEDVHYSMIDRPAGARAAVLAAGGTWLDIDGSDCARVSCWRERLDRRERESAVIAYNPMHILPVLHAALLLGLRVPEDLSLVTFHNEPVYLLDHHITYLEIPEAELAGMAVQHLCARIGGGPSRSLNPEPFILHSSHSSHSSHSIAPPPSR